MASNPLGGILGNQTFQQLMVWQIVGQLINSALAPAWAGIQAEAYRIDQSIPLGVADAVDAWIKGHMTEAEAKAEAALSGISNPRMDTLGATAGEPPGVATLLEMWRRRVIPESGSGPDAVSVEQGIREGRTKNKWIAPYKELLYALPSPQAALQAYLEGQTTEADARAKYAEWGGDPRYFELMFNTQGSAPTPNEAAEMARRGIIPWEGDGPGVTSYRQAFLEGPWRNKWLEPYRALADYIPPPRATTAMLRNGSITDAQALKFYAAAGATGEVAAALLADAHHRSTEADRELTKTDILGLYYSQLIPRGDAEQFLSGLNYPPEVAAYLLDATDFRREKALLDQAVGRIRALYVAHRIDKAAAVSGLDSLGLPTANRDHLLLFWDQERALTVKLLTAADIARAVKLQLLTLDQAGAELVAQGYTERDAALYLAIHAGIETSGASGA